VVIDGIEEANYIFKGVSLCHPFKKKSMIMDIGGGSTEFILADSSGIIELDSMDIGVSRLFQMFQCSDPFTAENVRDIEAFIENKSNGFFENKEVGILIGSSGTFETFYELIYKCPFPHGKQTMELELEPFLKSLDELIFSTLEDRNQNDFIIPIRKKMAPFAAVKTRWVIRQLNVLKVIISPFSLKEGALL
jgi:exopolyphosphatase/guanosine-5'-triphosphate,3'-diphosphate pyrophosphatase